MASPRHIATVAALGMAQTLAWASSYYLPALLAGPIARDLNARGEIWAAETAARIEAEYQCIPLSEV